MVIAGVVLKVLLLHQEIKEQGNRKFKIKKNEYIVRLHIGLEDIEDLIRDLKKSLKYIR